LILPTQVDQRTSKSGAPITTGGNSSLIEMNTSATSRNKTSVLMLMDQKMKKEDQLSFGTDTMERTRDGKSFTLTKQSQFNPRDLTRNTDSTAQDHSTSSQDFQ
jgi:hypothetical protein